MQKPKLPVRVRYSFVQLLTGSDLAARRLPKMSAISELAGPVVWLTACIHGDEIVGMGIIQEIFKRIRRKLLRGSVYAFPLANPIGVETMSRKITLSGEDLNRSFPGDAGGSLAERIAERIFSSITETSPDLVLDLHSDWKRSIPYTIIDLKPATTSRAVFKRMIELSRLAGFVCIHEDEEEPTSLSYNLLSRNIPALTLELGEPYVINEKNVGFGLGAIWNILAGLEMIEPQSEPFLFPLPTGYRPKTTLTYTDKPYSSKSGIVRFLAEPGNSIKQGEPFARIVNAFGKHQETLTAATDGIVLGHTDSSVVFPGMPVMAFGINAT